MRVLSFAVVLTIASVCKATTPQVQFAWKQLDYAWKTPADRETAIQEGRFIPENNLPIGLVRWKSKLFVTVTKWRQGVVSSLNYIDVDGAQDQPLKPYPSFEDNFIPDDAKALPSNSSVVSVFRLFVDACDRLWVMDTGIADIFGIRNEIARPSILIFDLNTDQLLRRYFFKDTDAPHRSLFGNIIVEVNKDSCEDAFAYAADISRFGVVVYSLKQHDSWRVEHHYFHIDPLAGSYNVSRIQFQWKDGVFGMALSEPRDDGYRTMFFHPFSSTKEFSVSTELLRNYRHLDVMEIFHDFKLVGDRGKWGQASSSVYDQNSHAVFYTQVNRDGVGCWNILKPYTVENNPLIISDPIQLEFPNDVKVDEEGTLWMLSNKIPRYFYRKLDPSDINFRILNIKASDAIVGTACED